MTPIARDSDPLTSHTAAASVHVARGHRIVLIVLKEEGPMCDQKLLAAVRSRGIKLSDSGLRTRRSELVTMGFVRDTGRLDILPTGRQSIIWEAIR